MTKLKVTMAFKFLSKRQGCARIEFVLSFGRIRKSAFDISRLHWP